MLIADIYHLVHVQITMSESSLYKKIYGAISKESQAGDEEALALMTAAVVMEAPGNRVSALSFSRPREVLS